MKHLLVLLMMLVPSVGMAGTIWNALPTDPAPPNPYAPAPGLFTEDCFPGLGPCDPEVWYMAGTQMPITIQRKIGLDDQYVTVRTENTNLVNQWYDITQKIEYLKAALNKRAFPKPFWGILKDSDPEKFKMMKNVIARWTGKNIGMKPGFKRKLEETDQLIIKGLDESTGKYSHTTLIGIWEGSICCYDLTQKIADQNLKAKSEEQSRLYKLAWKTLAELDKRQEIIDIGYKEWSGDPSIFGGMNGWWVSYNWKWRTKEEQRAYSDDVDDIVEWVEDMSETGININHPGGGTYRVFGTYSPYYTWDGLYPLTDPGAHPAIP